MLAGVGLAATGVIAGCTEDLQGGDDEDAPDDTEEPPDDVGDRDPAGTAAGSKSATATASGTEDPAGTGTPTGTATGTPSPTATATENTSACADVVPDVVDSVAIDATMEHPEDGTVELTGRTHGEDMYYEFVTDDGTVFELYAIEDDYYSVSPQGCVLFSDLPDTGYAAPEEEFTEDGFWADEEPDRTEVIDGEEMVVYEFEVETSTYDYELTVYVRCSTGRIYRADQYVPSAQSSTVAYYENWGNTEPISPPDVDCQEV